jgi:glutamate synthase domain-containing protein 3
MEINARGVYYRRLNEQIREAVERGEREIVLRNVNGQRYIGAGLRGKDVAIEVNGVPGNDLAAFMDGPTVHVMNNAQDGCANTMNAGRLFVHGDAGDVVGYGMRGGSVYVKGHVGYRVGIHMKAYKTQSPVIVAGGTAGDFFGEYLAGGTLILLGMERDGQPLVGDYCGTGIHGGRIYLRGEYDGYHVSAEHISVAQAGSEDMEAINPELEAFAAAFGIPLDQILSEPFVVLRPKSHRPFGDLYVSRP